MWGFKLFQVFIIKKKRKNQFKSLKICMYRIGIGIASQLSTLWSMDTPNKLVSHRGGIGLLKSSELLYLPISFWDMPSKQYTFWTHQSILSRYLLKCGLCESLKWETFTFGDVQHMCWKERHLVRGWWSQFIHHSGRMIKIIHRFMFLRETYEVIPKRTKFFH